MKLKRVKVVMLPINYKEENTANHEDLWIGVSHRLIKGNVFQNLYFISDDPIKKGDWYFTPEMKTAKYGVHFCDTDSLARISNGFESKKIIATTNKSLKVLNKYSNEEGIMELLPQPSEAFIRKYCELGGIDEVMVEWEENQCDGRRAGVSIGDNNTHLFERKIDRMICTKGKYNNPKVDSHNTITIRPIKDSWNKEEVVQLISKYWKDEISNGNIYGKEGFTKWIRENIK